MLRSHSRRQAVLFAIVAVIAVAVTSAVAGKQHARLIRLTPILSVESIEPSVPFWTALGWESLNPLEVDGKLAFIAFRKDGQEIHYQSFDQIERRMSGARDMLAGSTALLYVTVDNVNTVVEALGADADVVIARSRTPWGADELYVREPGGHLIGFAEFRND